MKYDITCSIVLHRQDRADLEPVLRSVLGSRLNIKLYLIDNSPTDNLRDLSEGGRVEYVFNNANVGYGSGHNKAITRVGGASKYHLVLNPDVEFGEGVLERLFGFMERNESVLQVMPKIYYRDGSLQKLCKLLPTPYDLLGRRFFQGAAWAAARNRRYELEGFEYDRLLNVPNLSGCFMFIRTGVLQKVGGFDPRYFMYMEDIDLTRRIHALGDTLFFPYVHIRHGFTKESYFNATLLRYHVTSAIRYFNKWGWLSDPERKVFNARVTGDVHNKIALTPWTV